jgi:hypothetical protein
LLDDRLDPPTVRGVVFTYVEDVHPISRRKNLPIILRIDAVLPEFWPTGKRLIDGRWDTCSVRAGKLAGVAESDPRRGRETGAAAD